METMQTTQTMPTRPRRRPVARPAAPPSKIKTAVHLSPEAFRRLGIAAVMEGRSQSDIVEQLIAAGLRHYVVSVRGDRSGPACDNEIIGQDCAAA